MISWIQITADLNDPILMIATGFIIWILMVYAFRIYVAYIRHRIIHRHGYPPDHFMFHDINIEDDEERI